MITKEDANNYLKKMLKTEIEMRKGYLYLYKHLKNSSLKKQFLELANEESEHAALVMHLIDGLKHMQG
ncbi:MAG: ferritin-like domain-containing protein [Parachlamydiales bacterium]|nr:ferritin-like domain-containing protein [Parachlamydiales bacterium]